jgi:hypothetical protein
MSLAAMTSGTAGASMSVASMTSGASAKSRLSMSSSNAPSPLSMTWAWSSRSRSTAISPKIGCSRLQTQEKVIALEKKYVHRQPAQAHFADAGEHANTGITMFRHFVCGASRSSAPACNPINQCTRNQFKPDTKPAPCPTPGQGHTHRSNALVDKPCNLV